MLCMTLPSCRGTAFVGHAVHDARISTSTVHQAMRYRVRHSLTYTAQFPVDRKWQTEVHSALEHGRTSRWQKTSERLASTAKPETHARCRVTNQSP